MSKKVLVEKIVPDNICALTLAQTNPGFHVSALQFFLKHCFENTVGKGELLVTNNFAFYHCSLPVFYPFREFSSFSLNLKLSANAFSLEESKICCLGKG